ncbi:hypothetical protein BGLA2_260051 [Burkholderia gladioli]|nr:hypothetical protein BGLA2_260051 [Burkholderia gladioli]
MRELHAGRPGAPAAAHGPGGHAAGTLPGQAPARLARRQAPARLPLPGSRRAGVDQRLQRLRHARAVRLLPRRLHQGTFRTTEPRDAVSPASIRAAWPEEVGPAVERRAPQRLRAAHDPDDLGDPTLARAGAAQSGITISCQAMPPWSDSEGFTYW